MHSLAVWCGHRRLETSEHHLGYYLVVIGPCWMNGSYRLPIDIDSVHVWLINDRWAIATAVARSRHAVAFVIRLAENHSVDVRSSSWYMCSDLFGPIFNDLRHKCATHKRKNKNHSIEFHSFFSKPQKTSMLMCFASIFFTPYFEFFEGFVFVLYWFSHTSQFIIFLLFDHFDGFVDLRTKTL